jgi:hypothetical protein
MSPGKPDGLVWHFGLSGFPALRPSYLTDDRHVHNDHLLRNSLHPEWKCIGGGAHGAYHPAQGGQGGYIIGGGPHDLGIHGPTGK